MKTWLRKLRGVVGVGVTWGAVFGTLMFLLATVIGMVDPDSIGPGEEPYRLGAIVGGVGFLCGASFALLLAWAERRKPIAKLSVARAAIWGALGAAAFPVLGGMPNVANILMFVCPLGAALASATVALARRADRVSADRLTAPPSDMLPH